MTVVVSSGMSLLVGGDFGWIASQRRSLEVRPAVTAPRAVK